MVRRDTRGMSLMSALLLVTIVVIIATVMAAVFTLNINITNRVSNGSVALSEAEAGISEVLYQISHKDNIEQDGNQENPKITWGLDGETLRSTITPGMRPDEAYHVVTFDTGSSFPYSTNNTTLDNDSGYNGRVVPDGMLHIISTGYCKGQYRTIECVIEKPPFPFGLATSGPINSVDPIRVLGTTSQASYEDGETDRPGHILCNSPEGVVIGAGDGEGEGDGDETKGTFISGFVKSVGPVSIAQPATVRGGIRSHAEATTLTDIKIEDFNLDNPIDDGKVPEGVITLVDNEYDKDQVLDVMYKYLGGGTLKYNGKIELQQAMLWVDGNLEIAGPVTGEGLIVATGYVKIFKGADLNGTDKMALIAGGDVTLGQEGGLAAANHFSGLVYTEGDLDAKNITVVGNAVANSPDPAKGRATLENVILVSNEQTGDMTVTITTVRGAEESRNEGHKGGISPDFNWTGTMGEGGPYWIGPDVSNEDLEHIADVQMRGLFFGAEGNFSDADPFALPPVGNDPFGFGQQLHDLAAEMQVAQETVQANLQTISDLKAERDGLTPADGDDSNDQDRIDEINGLISTLEGTNTGLVDAAEITFNEKALKLLTEVRDKTRKNANEYGTVKTESREGQEIITRDERFNLNEYLPQSDRLKISFWKVYPRRM